jgi:hypothetical protein
MVSIYLYSRGDRLGGHLLQYMSIIIYAFYHNLYIVYDYDTLKFTNSIFVRAILAYINNHNKKCNIIVKDSEKYKNMYIQKYWLDFEKRFDPNDFFYSEDLLIITTQVVYSIKSDIISYYKKYISHNMYRYLEEAKSYNDTYQRYIIPFDKNKTILIHLRLEDVRDREDYDGSICSNYYKNRIDNNYENIQGITNNVGYSNRQTPLAREKIELAISQAKTKYPEHEVIIITAPGDYEIDYPYRCIRSDDESYDLFLLCNADVLILSRSTFSLMSTFFGKAREIWSPLWGHFVCTGLYTKYDNSKFNYFF